MTPTDSTGAVPHGDSSFGRNALRTRWFAVALGLATGAAAATSPGIVPLISGIAILVAIWVWLPSLGLASLLFSRSSLDWFQNAAGDQKAFVVNPASALGLFFIVGAAALIAFRLRSRQRIDLGGRFGLAWGGWVAFSGLGLFVALIQLGGSEFASAVREYIRLVSLLGVFLFVANFATDPWSRKALLWATVAGVFIPILVGTYQLIVGAPLHQIDGVSRIYGTFVHPNAFGAYLATITMVSLGLWEDRFGGKNGRVLLATVVILSLFALIFTYSRSSLGILFFALLLWGFRGSRRRKITMAVSTAVGVTALAPFLAWRFADLLVSGDPSTERTNSFVWRLLNFKMLLGKFLESPLVGFGLRGAGFVNPVRTASQEGHDRGFAAHNEVVRVLVEQGALGLIAYIAVAYLLLSTTKSYCRRTDSPDKLQFPGLARATYCVLWAFFLACAVGSEIIAATSVLYVLLTIFAILHTSSHEGSQKLQA